MKPKNKTSSYAEVLEESGSSARLIHPEAMGQFVIETASVTTQPKGKDKNGNPDYANQKNQNKDGKDPERINPETLQVFGESVARKRAENKRLLQVVADFNSIVKLVVAGAQNPNTLERGRFKYNFPGESKIHEAIRSSIVRHVEGYAEEKYQYSNNLESEISEMLAKSGSVFKIILPPDRIQKVIRSDAGYSLENLNRELAGHLHYDGTTKEFLPEPVGIFGTTDNGFSMENAFRNSPSSPAKFPEFDEWGGSVKIKAIDNPLYLRNNELEEYYAAKRIEETYNKIYAAIDDDDDYSLEANARYVYKEGEKNEFKLPVRRYKFTQKQLDGVPVDFDKVEITEVKGEKGDTKYFNLMSPVVSVWPPESVVVVQRKGGSKKRLGYLGILGRGGAPLTIEDDSAILRVRTDRAMRDSGTQNVLKRIRDDIYASREERDNNRHLAENHHEILDHFKFKVNKFLMESISNGVLGKTAEIVPTDEVMLNMLYTALEEKEIRVVFIPERFVQHYALEYDEYGMGKTMFDDGRLLFNMKAALVYAQTYAAITSARPIKDVIITVDPDSPDPKREALQRLEAVLRSEHLAMPWTNISESNLERNVLLSGMNVTFTGNDNLPQSNTEVKETSRQMNQIDREITELIDDTCYKSIGWTKEVANWFNDMEIATTVISNNLQVARRIQHIQNILTDLTKSFMLKTLTIDGEFIGRVLNDLLSDPKQVRGIMKELGVDTKSSEKDTREAFKALKRLLPKYLRELAVELPRPDTSVINAKRRELDDFLSMLDAVIEGYINEDMFDGTEEMRNHIRSKKSVIRSGLIRWYNQSRDAIPELNSLFDVNGDSPLTEEHNDYIDKLGNAILKATKKLKADDIDFKYEVDDLIEEKEKERQEELERRNSETAEEEGDLVDDTSGTEEDSGTEEEDAPSSEETPESEEEAEAPDAEPEATGDDDNPFND